MVACQPRLQANGRAAHRPYILCIGALAVTVRICRVEVGRITAGLNRRRRYKHMEMQAREAGRRGCSRRRSIRLVSIRVRGPVAAAACVPAMGGFGFELAVGDEAAE